MCKAFAAPIVVFQGSQHVPPMVLLGSDNPRQDMQINSCQPAWCSTHHQGRPSESFHACMQEFGNLEQAWAPQGHDTSVHRQMWARIGT